MTNPAMPSVMDLYNPNRFGVNAADCELFERELRSFVPPGGFDAHAHLYDLSLMFPQASPDELGGPAQVTYAIYRSCQGRWMGDRQPKDGLFIPFPRKNVDPSQASKFVADEVAHRPQSRGLLMIGPGDDPVKVEAHLDRWGLAGFKVYHVYADQPNTFEATSEQFIPEWAWELAQQRGLWITLHLLLRRALADPLNQRYIREHCLRYPNARLVLAHAARGFCSDHVRQGVAGLTGLDNVFFDTAAVCESDAFETLLKVFGPGRMMYGSDFGISELRGRAINLADGFFWLYEHNVLWEGWTLGRPTLVGIESLLALKRACQNLHLSDHEIEGLFGRNARQLLGIEPQTQGTGQALYREAKKLIPGGVQLLSKRPEMFAPEQWPAYYKEARGCQVVDMDGRTFIDMSISGIGSCLLGYADPEVTDAVIRRVRLGSMCTLNNPEEVELAQLLLGMHPWADNVRYGRGGGEAMAMAVRIARAATRRDRVAFCGYHGWSDWYLAANIPHTDSPTDALAGHLLPGLDPAGVPAALRQSALPFNYNKLDELEAIVQKHGPTLAAVVMEPTRSVDPDPGFLEGVRALCDRCGAKLVFDEITIGFRLACGGAHLKYGITPDVAVFAKALGNGHPMAAIIGKAPTMRAAQESFISSTYWTEGVGPAAAIATLKKLQRIDLPSHLAGLGLRLRQGYAALAIKHGLKLKFSGHPAIGVMSFDHPQAAAMQTLLTARMLQKGFLCSAGFYVTLAHQQRHVDSFLTAADAVFALIAEAARKDEIERHIGGPIKHSGFARLA